MLLYDVLQQGLPMNVVPDWIETKGTMSIVSLRPRYPTDYFSAFKISDECLIVQNWTRYVMGERRQVLGGSKQMCYPKLGDKSLNVSWLEDLHTVKKNYFPGLRNLSTQNVRPIVFVLNYGHIYLGKMVSFYYLSSVHLLHTLFLS